MFLKSPDIPPVFLMSIDDLVVDPTMPTLVYAGTSDALYKTTDGGASWRLTGSGTDTRITGLTIDPTDPTILYGGNGRRVFRVTDGAATWNLVAELPARVAALAIDPFAPARIYAATIGTGVFTPEHCGDGMLDAGETCDDGNIANGDCCSSACAYESAGTVCRPSIGECDLAEQCVGFSADCPDELPLADASVCDDGDLCTVDRCGAGGRCAYAPNVATSCTSADHSTLRVTLSDGHPSRLFWTWTGAPATPSTALGDPTVDVSYALCAHSDAGLVLSTRLPAGKSWHAAQRHGYRYRDRRGVSDGIRRAAMIASTPNRTRVMVKGGGAHLPALGSGASAPLPLRVQLVNDANATCFEATFDADAVISLTGEVLEASR